MNHVNEVSAVSTLNKLSIEKKTIRTLTDVETDDVGGGISFIAASSLPCAEGVFIAAAAASARWC